jgi:hypothetical protein
MPVTSLLPIVPIEGPMSDRNEGWCNTSTSEYKRGASRATDQAVHRLTDDVTTYQVPFDNRRGAKKAHRNVSDSSEYKIPSGQGPSVPSLGKSLLRASAYRCTAGESC